MNIWNWKMWLHFYSCLLSSFSLSRKENLGAHSLIHHMPLLPTTSLQNQLLVGCIRFCSCSRFIFRKRRLPIFCCLAGTASGSFYKFCDHLISYEYFTFTLSRVVSTIFIWIFFFTFEGLYTIFRIFSCISCFYVPPICAFNVPIINSVWCYILLNVPFWALVYIISCAAISCVLQ